MKIAQKPDINKTTMTMKRTKRFSPYMSIDSRSSVRKPSTAAVTANKLNDLKVGAQNSVPMSSPLDFTNNFTNTTSIFKRTSKYSGISTQNIKDFMLN